MKFEQFDPHFSFVRQLNINISTTDDVTGQVGSYQMLLRQHMFSMLIVSNNSLHPFVGKYRCFPFALIVHDGCLFTKYPYVV